MKIKKKYQALIIFILICLSIFLIYKNNNKNNVNYTSLGDGFSLGKDSFGRIDYGYSDYVKDYLLENKKLNKYIKSFSDEKMNIEKLYEYILINKKITLKNKEFNLRNVLRETEILTMSIGLNDLIYGIATIQIKSPFEVDNVINEIDINFNTLINEIKKYYKGKIYVIGYYKSPLYNSITNDSIEKLNKIFKENKDVVYIAIDNIINDNNNFSNPNSYYPNRIGHKIISQKIISKISKSLEK